MLARVPYWPLAAVDICRRLWECECVFTHSFVVLKAKTDRKVDETIETPTEKLPKLRRRRRKTFLSEQPNESLFLKQARYIF